MIFKSNFPSAPDVELVLSGASVDYTAIDYVEVSIEENKHDLAIIEFVGLPTSAITDYIGIPVYVSVSSGPSRSFKFYGNVSYVEPMMATRRGSVNNSPVQRARVVCFGASHRMVESKSKVWEKTTIPFIVSALAERYDFSYSVPNDYFVWDRLLQNQESDWAFLVKVCNSIGYYVTCTGTHIHVYDPYKAIARSLPYVELETLHGVRGNVDYAPGRILEFEGTFGDKTPEGVSDATKMVGIDARGSVITSDMSLDVDEPEYTGFGEAVSSRFTNTINTEVDSLEMLNKFVGAINRSRYPFNAKVSVTGLPEVLPGSVAKINKYESLFDGYWLVRSVTHKLTRSNFVTTLQISTDSTDRTLPRRNPTAAYVVPPDPTLSNNEWVSSKLVEEVYV